MTPLTDPDDLVFASLPLAVMGYAMTLGIAHDELITISGLPATSLRDPDARVEYESLIRLWSALLERFEGRALGLEYAGFLTPTTLGILGYACSHCQNLGEAIELYARYCRLADPHLLVTVEQQDGFCRVAYDHEPRVEAMAEPMEMMVAATILCARRMNPSATRPLEVCMRHRQRHPMTRYQEVLGTTVRFEAKWTGVSFDQATLELPIMGADPRVGRYLRRQVEAIDPRPARPAHSPPLDERVRTAIEQTIASHTSDPATVARALGMSARSLQRRLQAHGTSFSEQLDAVRRSHALRLLRDPQRSIREIAFMLGYSDPRAFYRGFRRWTGRTPAEYRREREDER